MSASSSSRRRFLGTTLAGTGLAAFGAFPKVFAAEGHSKSLLGKVLRRQVRDSLLQLTSGG